MRTLREAPSPQREESQQRSVIVVVPAASEATIIERLIATLAACEAGVSHAGAEIWSDRLDASDRAFEALLAPKSP